MKKRITPHSTKGGEMKRGSMGSGGADKAGKRIPLKRRGLPKEGKSLTASVSWWEGDQRMTSQEHVGGNKKKKNKKKKKKKNKNPNFRNALEGEQIKKRFRRLSPRSVGQTQRRV